MRDSKDFKDFKLELTSEYKSVFDKFYDKYNSTKDTEFLNKIYDLLLEAQRKSIPVSDLNFNENKHKESSRWSQMSMGQKSLSILKYLPIVLFFSTIGDTLVKVIKNYSETSTFSPTVNINLTPVLIIEILVYFVFLLLLLTMLERKAFSDVSKNSKEEVIEFIKIYGMIVIFLVILVILETVFLPKSVSLGSLSINIFIYYLILIVAQILLLAIIKDKSQRD